MNQPDLTPPTKVTVSVTPGGMYVVRIRKEPTPGASRGVTRGGPLSEEAKRLMAAHPQRPPARRGRLPR
jgi:hypothetical protein